MRLPAVSGVFYPDDRESLKECIKGCFFSGFGPGSLPVRPKKNSLNNSLKGIIAPHAGYAYSGPCAAYAYKAVAEAEKPDLFIILGLSHSGFDSCIGLDDWKTSLGTAKVDKGFGKLLADYGIPVNEAAHAGEHSIEVQLVFLQFLFDDFRFVPVIVSDDFRKVAGALMKALKHAKKKAVIIASSDFTHYGAGYGYIPFKDDIKKRMHALDAGAIRTIKSIDTNGFLEYLHKTGATVCGRHAVAALLECVMPAKAKLLKYYTSADISGGDYSCAVGYASIAFLP